jgi:hypothetical protein
MGGLENVGLADVFKKAKKVVTLGRCSAVYNGTVAHPE